MTDKKRYFPEMHSAEHILNGTMDQMFGNGRAFSAHIERKKSKCDYKGFDKELTEDQIDEIQDKVNEIINLNVDITEEFLPRKEAAKLFNLERLPDTAGETLRIIKVGDYDSCPCIGEHVKNTSEIGEFRITSTNYNEDRLRLIFKLFKDDEE